MNINDHNDNEIDLITANQPTNAWNTKPIVKRMSLYVTSILYLPILCMRNSKEFRYNAEEIFCPPLWRQRRNFIQDVLTRYKAETVLDYGCGEAAVLSFLIPPAEHKITKMAGIDIDADVLEEAIESCRPWKTDFEQLRLDPLTIDIFQGSIGIPDDRFKGFQAIICTEVIEHVYADVLDQFLDLTLGIYHPAILVVTTPNAEYNVNFPDLKYGTPDASFRHDDHKFEWTRKEFQSWCEQGAAKYHYDIEYHGIGLLSNKLNETENGHCTQACIFTRQALSKRSDKEYGYAHQLVKHIEFPYYQEAPLSEEDIMDELEHYIETFCQADNYYRQQEEEKPRSSYYSEQEQDQLAIDADVTVDWNTINISNYSILTTTDNVDHPDCSTVKHTSSPIFISSSSLWNILRIRQICKAEDCLKAILVKLCGNYPKDFYWEEDDCTLTVYKTYPLGINDDENSISTVSTIEE